jgi:hypothetical protein
VSIPSSSFIDEAEDRPVAVPDRDRNDVDAFVLERPVDVVQLQLRLPAADLRCVPDVAEGAADRFRRRSTGEGVDRLTLAEVERADVIQPHEVIGVGVRVEDEVEPRDRMAQELDAEVGRRIDEQMLAVRLDGHRLPQPLVSRIGGGANAAVTAHYRDAGRGTGTEERHAHRGTILSLRVAPCRRLSAQWYMCTNMKP